MLVFLDTEFTSLEEPYLLSAGLVAGEREFYFEVSGVSPAICSPFVQTNVLPLLGVQPLQPIEISKQMKAFLAFCGPEVTFVCDAPRYDVELIKPFLPAGLRWNFAVPSFESHAAEQLFLMVKEDAFAQGLRRHHALDDAKALGLTWSVLR